MARKEKVMSCMEKYDLIVIGSGPGGEKAAVKAAYFGKKVAIIEKEHNYGGAGVNTGTLPSKTLREAALFFSGKYEKGLFGVERTLKHQATIDEFMFRKNFVIQSEANEIHRNLQIHKVAIFHGEASFIDEHIIQIEGDNACHIWGKFIIIATGSYPFHPEGIPFDNNRILDSDSILNIRRIPQSICIVGAGVIGCEYATIFATTFHGTATNALYADLAEKYLADQEYDSGTVLQFGGDKEVTIAMEANTNKIAGVVTTAPAFLMNDALNEANTVAVALQGRVPCKVIGKIYKGDMLVASAMPGVACAAEGEIRIGTVIGKSLENYDSDQVGVIEIAIGR